jgi:hypothetical protein
MLSIAVKSKNMKWITSAKSTHPEACWVLSPVTAPTIESFLPVMRSAVPSTYPLAWAALISASPAYNSLSVYKLKDKREERTYSVFLLARSLPLGGTSQVADSLDGGTLDRVVVSSELGGLVVVGIVRHDDS